MFDIINMFTIDYEMGDFFGKRIRIAAIFAMMDIGIRLGVISINFPSGIISVEISKAMFIIIKLAPIVTVPVVGSIVAHGPDSEADSNPVEEFKEYLKNAFISLRLYGTVFFIYSLYNFFSNFDTIVIEPSFGDGIIWNKYLHFVIYLLSYVYLFGAAIAEVNEKTKYRTHLVLKDEFGDDYDSDTVKYNTFIFQFVSTLVEEQSNEIKKMLLQKEDESEEKEPDLSEKAVFIKENIYVEMINNRLLIGLFEIKDGSKLELFYDYIRYVNDWLTEKGYRFYILASSEEYKEFELHKKENSDVTNSLIIRVVHNC